SGQTPAWSHAPCVSVESRTRSADEPSADVPCCLRKQLRKERRRQDRLRIRSHGLTRPVPPRCAFYARKVGDRSGLPPLVPKTVVLGPLRSASEWRRFASKSEGRFGGILGQPPLKR